MMRLECATFIRCLGYLERRVLLRAIVIRANAPLQVIVHEFVRQRVRTVITAPRVYAKKMCRRYRVRRAVLYLVNPVRPFVLAVRVRRFAPSNAVPTTIARSNLSASLYQEVAYVGRPDARVAPLHRRQASRVTQAAFVRWVRCVLRMALFLDIALTFVTAIPIVQVRQRVP